MKYLILVLFYFSMSYLIGQVDSLFPYPHDTVRFQDHAPNSEGFWLFEPKSPKPDSAGVVVFLHGYGALNPMIYGAWIKHIVRQGYIVIYPRYQRNLLFPRPPAFPKKASAGIRAALDSLKTGVGHVRPLEGPIIYAAHSYGGVIASNLAVHYEEHDIPPPGGLLLAAPGSGPFSGGVLKDYSQISDSIPIVITIHERDRVVKDKLGRRIFEQVPGNNKLLLLQMRDSLAQFPAHHNEVYALDLAFDTGLRNYTSNKALRVATTDKIDQLLFWANFDRILTHHFKSEDTRELKPSFLRRWYEEQDLDSIRVFPKERLVQELIKDR